MNDGSVFLKPIEALLAAALLTAIAWTGWLDDLDYRISDRLYQTGGEKNPDIVVIGIDKVTLSKLGPASSLTRAHFAQAVEYLNNHDPNARPAVIGIDVLFTGENADDPEGDRRLVAAVAQYGNVVVASEADVLDDDAPTDDIYAEWAQTWEWIPPFPALAAAADTGHINAPNEADGIVRHDLLYVNVTERGRLYSFSRVIYEKWCAFKKITPKAPPPTEGNGVFYLPFTAKSYAGGNNFWDLLEGTVNSSVYRDKIVLIAPYAPGLQDSAPTALDRSDVMYGIDVHANAIEAYQKGFFPREIDRTSQLMILFVACFIAKLFFRNAKAQNMIIVWLLAAVGWIVLCHVAYRHELILHVIWIPFAVSFLFVAAIIYNYMHTRTEKERVVATFERYVDPTIMEQLLAEGSDAVDVGGKLRDIAVLFVDIRGFTSMSEVLLPVTIVDILNRYLTLTTDCIRRHHGTLDKFVGDCTMAFWNAPIDQERPVHLACRAALDMIEGSEKLRAEILREHGRDITFGIGIHWGSAVVGNIGTAFRMDYTAIGDTVNTAARLEANAPGGVILISRAVADVLGDDADVTSLGNSIKLKGKRENFEILRLNSLRE